MLAMAAMNKPMIRVPAGSAPFVGDGFVNFASRIGTPSDKSSYAHYRAVWADYADIDAAYSTSWFRKIVDIPPFDETREWRAWLGLDDAQVAAIDAEEKRLDLRRKVRDARILARKDGGALLLMGIAGQDPSQPLGPVPRGALQFLTVLSRWEVAPGPRDNNPMSPSHGAPEYYTLTDMAATRVHPSRVVRFIGNAIRDRRYYDGWGESIWIEMRDAVVKADQIAAGIASMVDEGKIDVVRIKNLMSNMATAEYEGLLARRWASIMTLKSSVNALILDADDEYEQKTLTFQGLTDIQNNALMVMSGKADIPATRLLGRSPQGMNATGESDLRNYYDRIRAGQQTDLSPTLRPLDMAMLASVFGAVPPDAYVEWNPLYQMSEKEAADVEKVFADTAERYANMGMVPDTAMVAMVRGGIIERGQWPGADKAFSDADAAGEMPDALDEPDEAQPEDLVPPPVPEPVTDAAPRTLYVRRDVVNAAAIKAWARSHGFASTVDDMHVTIALSRTAIDWMKVPDAWMTGRADGRMTVAAGGARLVEPLGDGGAVVLLFNSTELAWRHMAIREAGASWDFPEYQPHVTLTYEGNELDLSKIEPYRGPIELGPEVFEEVKDLGTIEHTES